MRIFHGVMGLEDLKNSQEIFQTTISHFTVRKLKLSPAQVHGLTGAELCDSMLFHGGEDLRMKV